PESTPEPPRTPLPVAPGAASSGGPLGACGFGRIRAALRRLRAPCRGFRHPGSHATRSRSPEPSGAGEIHLPGDFPPFWVAPPSCPPAMGPPPTEPCLSWRLCHAHSALPHPLLLVPQGQRCHRPPAR